PIMINMSDVINSKFRFAVQATSRDIFGLGDHLNAFKICQPSSLYGCIDQLRANTPTSCVGVNRDQTYIGQIVINFCYSSKTQDLLVCQSNDYIKSKLPVD